MADGGLDGLQVSGTESGDGEQLHDIRTGLIGVHDIRWSQCAGHGHHSQLPGPTDYGFIDIGRNDEQAAGFVGQFYQMLRGNGTGTYQHSAGKSLGNLTDGSRSGGPAVGIALVVSNFHQPDAAVIEGLSNLQTLLRLNAADNGHNLMFIGPLYHCFTHIFHLKTALKRQLLQLLFIAATLLDLVLFNHIIAEKSIIGLYPPQLLVKIARIFLIFSTLSKCGSM